MSDNSQELLDLTAEIVAAFVANNNISPGDLGALIADTFTALSNLNREPVASIIEALTPAVSIRKSVTPDAIICLEDGKSFKSLKRHLGKLGMTPDEYRRKWGLPPDYPMVAPNYSEKRSAMATSMALGRRAAAGKPMNAPVTKAKRGRPRRSTS